MKITVTMTLVLSLMYQYFTNSVSSIQGKWASNEDRNYTLNITKDRFYEMYKKDTKGVCKYMITSKSCDNSYLNTSISNDPSLEFLSLDDGRCFEITGVTKTTLAYRHTASGRLAVFNKIKTKKRR